MAHLSWGLGAYFLGAVFASIAHQLFGAPPAATQPPSRYHRAWCTAQLAALRGELETQARGALAAAAFDRAHPERASWYDRWQAWHQRVARACPLDEVHPLAEDLAELGAHLSRQCDEVGGAARDRVMAVDRQLEAALAENAARH